MPELHQYEIVDVFAESAYAGNQLAIVYIDGTESTEWLQRIANEFGFSETVFLPAGIPASAAVPTRIFTPRTELPFAGHPTLGAAWATWSWTASRSILPRRLASSARGSMTTGRARSSG